MSLSSFVSRVIPAAVGFVTGGPIGAVSAAAATEQAKKQEKIIKQQINEANARRAKEMEFFGNTGSSIPTIQANLAASRPVVSTASSGGGFFDTVRGGLREVGGFVSDVFSSGIPQLLGYSRPPGIAQQPAVTSVTNIGAQESQGSGSIQAGVGTLLPQALGAARNLLRTPQGQLALGGGGAVIGSMFGGEGKTMRITRKMKKLIEYIQILIISIIYRNEE